MMPSTNFQLPRVCRTVLLAAVVILAAAKPSLAASLVQQAGGSVYVAFNLDPASLKTNTDWTNSLIFHHPICQFDTGRAVIRRDMEEMVSHGQRKIATDLWHARLPASTDCGGFLLNSRGGEFQMNILHNLRSFVALAGEVGFNEVQLRFDPLSRNDPMLWKAWDESLFEENQSIILTTIDALKNIEKPKVFFDLGGELGGAFKVPFVRNYVQRIWRAAMEHTDLDHTVGFSIAYAPGKIQHYIEWLREIGPLPNGLSLTIYQQPYDRLSSAIREARASGYDPPHFLIQETYYDDAMEYEAFVRAARDQKAIIRAIMQWPVVPGVKAHISEGRTPLFVYHPQER